MTGTSSHRREKEMKGESFKSQFTQSPQAMPLPLRPILKQLRYMYLTGNDAETRNTLFLRRSFESADAQVDT